MDARKEELGRLVDVIDRLRAEDGCPWDREQTLATLVPCLLEEAAETADAVAGGDPDAVQEELGDVLMNVTLMSRIAEQEGRFSLADAARGICEKLIRRHPHVFGDTQVANAREVLVRWNEIKAQEKGTTGRASRMDGIPAQFSALQRAHKLAERAASIGFDWSSAEDALAKVEEEVAEVRSALRDPARRAAELGDLLFAVVCTCRRAGVDPDFGLREACEKFERRFRFLETRLGDGLEQAGLEAMERAWQEAKEAGL